MRSVVLALAVIGAVGLNLPQAAALCFSEGPQLGEIGLTPGGLVFAVAPSDQAPALEPDALIARSWDLESDPPAPLAAPITRIELVRATGWRPDRALTRAVDAENAAYWTQRRTYSDRLEAGAHADELDALDPGRQPTAPQSFAIYRMQVERTLRGDPRARFELATQMVGARRIPIIAPRGRNAEDRQELRERGLLREVSRSDECQYGYGFRVGRRFVLYWANDVLVGAARVTPQAYAAMRAPE